MLFCCHFSIHSMGEKNMLDGKRRTMSLQFRSVCAEQRASMASSVRLACSIAGLSASAWCLKTNTAACESCECVDVLVVAVATKEGGEVHRDGEFSYIRFMHASMSSLSHAYGSDGMLTTRAHAIKSAMQILY